MFRGFLVFLLETNWMLHPILYEYGKRVNSSCVHWVDFRNTDYCNLDHPPTQNGRTDSPKPTTTG